MIDLSQVSLALRGVTERSLVVLDEFGKGQSCAPCKWYQAHCSGTNPADGAGLLTGVIEYLINGACPRTIVLTHFQSALLYLVSDHD
jgi:DNA mismatch repair protein MSH5